MRLATGADWGVLVQASTRARGGNLMHILGFALISWYFHFLSMDWELWALKMALGTPKFQDRELAQFWHVRRGRQKQSGWFKALWSLTETLKVSKKFALGLFREGLKDCLNIWMLKLRVLDLAFIWFRTFVLYLHWNVSQILSLSSPCRHGLKMLHYCTNSSGAEKYEKSCIEKGTLDPRLWIRKKN